MVPRDAAGPPAWAALASAVLRACFPAADPAQALLAFTLATPADADVGFLNLPAFHQVAPLPYGPLRRMAVALQRLGALGLPGAAQPEAAARAALTTPPLPGASMVTHLSGLAWLGQPGPGGRPRHRPISATAGTATVAALTGHQLAAAAAARDARHAAYAREAALAPYMVPPTPEHLVSAALRRAWREVPCYNTVRETVWRLTINAVPGAHIPAQVWQCPCDLHGPAIPSPRIHSFWACPIARAVRRQLTVGLPPGAVVRRTDLWLLQPPAGAPGLCPRAWSFVAMAALTAMEHGRRYLWALRRSPEWPDPGPAGHAALAWALPNFVFAAHVRRHILMARDALVTRVANAAAAHFWRTLQDFVFLHTTIPRRWALTPAHPFLHVRPDGTLGLALPAGVQAPPDEDDAL